MIIKPKVSVIIPNYNDSDTLPFCIESVLSSLYPEYEVIVVDDKSTDNSLDIISRYPVKLYRHDINRGQGAARNTGAHFATGEILFFTDADVQIKEDTIQKVVETFIRVVDAAAVVGLPDKRCVYHNLTSIHFNRRILYNYLRLPDYINVLYGTISAVKRDAFLGIGGFDEQITGVEDNEIGLRLVAKGCRIYHSKEIPVVHMKEIIVWEIFRNDFNRTVDRVKLLLGRKMTVDVIRKKRFITSPLFQLLSPFVAFVIVVTAVFSLKMPLFFLITTMPALVVFFALNSGYLRFICRDEGVGFSMRLFLFLVLDMFIVSLGLAYGVVLFFLGEKY